jgi:hypothetical protein
MTLAGLQASHRHTNNVFNNPLLRVEPAARTGTQGRHIAATAALEREQANAPILNLQLEKWEETCFKATHPNTGETVEYKQLLTSTKGHLWTECCAEEIGCLAQGYKCTAGTNTIHFIKITDVPPDQKATYLRLVVADRPNKENPRRVRFSGRRQNRISRRGINQNCRPHHRQNPHQQCHLYP